MSSISQGTDTFNALGYSLVSEGAGGDKQSGYTFTQVYEGRRVALDQLRVAYERAGARVDLSAPGGKATLTVTWYAHGTLGSNPATDTTETPVERYDLFTEPHQISLWRHPAVVAEAKLYQSRLPDSLGGNQYKKDLQDAVDNGEKYPFGKGSYPVAEKLFDALVMGEEYWETVRVSLRYTRTYTTRYTGTKLPLSLTTNVYTRDKLISQFQIPADVANSIPENPTDPLTTIPSGAPYASFLVWGWRMKSQQLSFNVATRRTEEVREWDFAQWNGTFYNIVQ